MFYQRVLPSLLALDQLGWERDSFEPDRKNFGENDRILAAEKTIVIQIKVEVFCSSNAHFTNC